MLDIHNFAFSYTQKAQNRALGGVSFQARRGECVFLLGKNGAGKSTLFRGILGLLRGYTGTICIDGVNIAAMSRRALAKKAAYVPQVRDRAFNCPVILAVMMGFNAHISCFRGPDKAREKEALAVLDSLGIAHLAERPCAEISGGERQLVLIARALAQKADLFIMDEPASSLDYGNQIRVIQKTREIAQKGALVLQSSHNPEHALLFADTVVVLQNGVVSACGPPRAALDAGLLRAVYDIPVYVGRVESEGGFLPVCVPVVQP